MALSYGVILALSGDDAPLLRAIDEPRSPLRVVRRCADVVELTGVGLAGMGRIAVISSDFDSCDASVVDRLRRAGVIVVVLVERNPQVWEDYADAVLPAETPAAEVAALLAALVAAAPLAPGLGDTQVMSPVGSEAGDGQPGHGTSAGGEPGYAEFGGDAAASVPPLPPAVDAPMYGSGPGGGPASPDALPPSTVHPGALPPLMEDEPAGRLVVVWGPQGSTGRSTVALALAECCSRAARTLLVDADVEAPSLAQLVGLPQESSALVTAARMAHQSALDGESFQRLCEPLTETLSIIAGTGRGGRWRELPPHAMRHVWDMCQEQAQMTVIDVSGGEVADECDDYTLEPGPGAMVAQLLGRADDVVVVGSADAVGMRRLIMHMDAAARVCGPQTRLHTVVNRVRESSCGPHPVRALRQTLEAFPWAQGLLTVAEDEQLVDRAVLEAVPVTMLSSEERSVGAFHDLSERILPSHVRGAVRQRSHASAAGMMTRMRQRLRRNAGPASVQAQEPPEYRRPEYRRAGRHRA